MTWYRNNVLHLLALPSMIACLLCHRHSPLSADSLQAMVARVYPYLRHELYLPDTSKADTDHWLAALVDLGMLRHKAIEGYSPPAGDSVHYYRMQTLSKVIMQSLERLYIVIALLHRAGVGEITRAELEQACQALAQRMSRLHGLNAPEFFDARLFRQFISQLIAHEVVSSDDHNKLQFTDAIAQVMRIAEHVIDTEFRLAVLRG
jgi:glycerol-3-phosphate O-acyltransferase